ncbi:hypothetical protein LGH83_08705 [Lichenihabitans sp. PAMC28606]|uniref:hypothetical protein n=1 Tax=Lichenihabitans sp. PAMC28606 TaxID=2880932 RepID=UPI001D0B47E6|nr:hypothetical protein [Lichenihabitans sp. PAMC28606]UDL96240.1 hypothetical protein LGH83_08705 [Lichenihabitans sp. PAMC28606]
MKTLLADLQSKGLDKTMIAVLTDKGYMLSDVPLWYFGHCLYNPRTNGHVRKVSFVEELDGQGSYLLTIPGNDMVYHYIQLKSASSPSTTFTTSRATTSRAPTLPT